MHGIKTRWLQSIGPKSTFQTDQIEKLVLLLDEKVSSFDYIDAISEGRECVCEKMKAGEQRVA